MKMQQYLIGVCLVIGLCGLAAGCPKPPKDALSEAEEAVAGARSKSECAGEKFEAANRLLEEAKSLSEDKEYEEARRKARAAAKLAREAKSKAEANWEECQERLAADDQEKSSEKADQSDSADEEQKQRARELELQTIHFGYDTADLTDEAREKLQENADWMRQHPDRRVVLEGHTDARGSIEYNLALGERRARSVKEYLIQLGVSGGRLNVLSYGEEKPEAYGDSESAYRKNRRVEFVPK